MGISPIGSYNRSTSRRRAGAIGRTPLRNDEIVSHAVQHQDSTYERCLAQPIAAFGVAIADMFLAMACAFSTCPQLHPYPTWMDAGSSGTSYYHVDVGADVEPGTYEATVTLIGYNHDPVDWDVVIVVEE